MITRWRRLHWAVRLFLGVLAIYVVSPAANVGDSRLSLPTAVSLYRHADMTLDEFPQVQALRGSYDVVEVKGHLVMGYPYAPALFLVPVAAVADLVPGVDPGSLSLASPNRTWLFELPVGAALTALAVVIFAFAARAAAGNRPRHHRRADVVVPLVLAVGTTLWSSTSRALSQHAAAAPFVALVIYLAVKSRTDARVVPKLGLVTALAYIMRPTNSVLVVGVTLWVLVCHRRAFLRYLGWAMVAAVPFVAINLTVYRAVLPPYYLASKLSRPTDLLGHIAGLLVSPSRGLLLYTPVLLLVPVGVWLRRRQGVLDSVDVLFLGIAVGLFSVAAVWPNWWGGSSYGPRLLTEMIPFLCWFLLPVADDLFTARTDDTRPTAPVLSRLTARAALIVACVLALIGVAIHSQGAAVRATLCWNSDPTYVEDHHERLWDWSDPQPLRGVRDLVHGRSLREVIIGSCADHGLPNQNTP